MGICSSLITCNKSHDTDNSPQILSTIPRKQLKNSTNNNQIYLPLLLNGYLRQLTIGIYRKTNSNNKPLPMQPHLPQNISINILQLIYSYFPISILHFSQEMNGDKFYFIHLLTTIATRRYIIQKTTFDIFIDGEYLSNNMRFYEDSLFHCKHHERFHKRKRSRKQIEKQKLLTENFSTNDLNLSLNLFKICQIFHRNYHRICLRLPNIYIIDLASVLTDIQQMNNKSVTELHFCMERDLLDYRNVFEMRMKFQWKINEIAVGFLNIGWMIDILLMTDDGKYLVDEYGGETKNENHYRIVCRMGYFTMFTFGDFIINILSTKVVKKMWNRLKINEKCGINERNIKSVLHSFAGLYFSYLSKKNAFVDNLKMRKRAIRNSLHPVCLWINNYYMCEEKKGLRLNEFWRLGQWLQEFHLR